MIVKEKDAFQHDCPQKLSADAFNRSCNGQSCMAWRWAVEDNPDKSSLNPFVRSKTHGYCGMAGASWRGKND